MVQCEVTSLSCLPVEFSLMVCSRSLNVDRISIYRRLVVVALSCAILCFTPVLAGAQGAAVEDIETVADEQIVAWVVELDDNRYAMRENAQFRLEKAGSAALNHVAKSARSGSLESSTRALNILLAWSEGNDPDLRIAALEQIIELPQRPTEAQQASQILAAAREQAALARIVELGGRYNIAPPMPGIPQFKNSRKFGESLQVKIGAHWKGDLDGLKLLNEIPRVTQLSLHSAPLNDELLPVLLDLPHLKRIELYGTKLSEPALKELREKLSSNIDLDVRSGALLGIKGNPLEQVVPNSAAAKAGLQKGDLITEFEGEKIDDYTVLIERIAVREPGDTVTLKIARLNRKLKKREQVEVLVTFDQWGKQPLTAPQPAVRPIQVVAPAGINIDRR